MKVTSRQQVVLTALDEQITDLEEKLARYQPLLDELAQLKRARAALLGIRHEQRKRGTLTQEVVVAVMREAGRPLTPMEISERTGGSGTVVRSHLSRWRGSLYRRDTDGWALIEPEVD